jgi:chromosome segregation ATPase
MPATTRFIPLGALLALTLGGCASQSAITEHTDPLRARLAQVEQAATASAGAQSAREAVLNARVNDMAAEIKALRAMLSSLTGDAKVLAERSAQAELRLDELASLNRDAGDAIAALDEAQAKTELRIDELASLNRDANDAIAALDEAQAKSVLRLDELATQGRDAEDRLDGLAERLTQADLRLDEAMTLARDASAPAPAEAGK